MAEYSETANGFLVIMVCRAKHLPNRRKLDKQSPYVVLRINTTAKKTPSHFRAGQTPEWTFEIRFKLGRERKPIMRLDVLDETKRDPTPIGGTEIDCLRVFLDPENRQDGGKYIWDSWHDLKFRNKPAGKIYLEMTFYPSTPVLPPKLGFHDSISPNKDVDVPEFRRLAPHLLPPLPTPVHTHPADDVFVHGKEKTSAFFRRSDPARTNTSPVVYEPKKDSKFDKFKSNFPANKHFSALLTDHSPISSPGKELPSYGDTFLSLFPLPPVTLKDLPPVTLKDRDNGVPPLPPPHTDYSSFTSSPERTTRSDILSARENLPCPKRSSNGSPRRKMPSDLVNSEPAFSAPKTTDIPFSAECFGLDDEPLPTSIYQMSQPMKSSLFENKKKNISVADDEIDPRHYAPTPSEHLAKSMRLQNGQMKFEDIKVDSKTEETGYLGEGKWDAKRFSPNIFDRLHGVSTADKPVVPPKIPQGLS